MKENITIGVNSEVLVWARNTLAMNRTNASEKSGISLQRLAQLEEGEREPTLEELKELSKTYKRTIATLLLNKPPKEKPLPSDRRTINSKDLGKYHESTIMAVRKARALVESLMELKQDAGVIIPAFQYRASILDDPEKVAGKFRTVLKLDEIREIKNINLALDGYIEKVEQTGVAVFQLSLTQDNLRGFSITDEAMPVIVVKRGSERPNAKIFTLFHEFGHLLLNDGGLCDLSDNNKQQIEKWCNTFAAKMLLPSSELLQMDIVKEHRTSGEKEWRKKDLSELADHFHIGLLSVLRSLLELKLTSKEFYLEKHRLWNKQSFGLSKNPEGRNIPKEIIKEKGRSYISLAFSAFDENKIDIKDLSDFLGVKLSYIPKTRELLNA